MQTACAGQNAAFILRGGSGHAIICSPEQIVLESREAGVFTVTVDLARIRWLRDQIDRSILVRGEPSPASSSSGLRPELYGPLSAR